jgi:hypothetical protein
MGGKDQSNSLPCSWFKRIAYGSLEFLAAFYWSNSFSCFWSGTNWVLVSNFDQYSGDIEAPTIQTYPLDFALLRGYNVLSFSAVTELGTATISVKINGVDVPGLNNLSITSTRLTVPVTTGNFVNVENRVELVVSATSTPKHLFFTVGRKYV